MEFEGMGKFEFDDDIKWYYGPIIKFKIFNNKECKFVIDSYEDEKHKQYENVMKNFLNISKSELYKANKEIYEYYKDSIKLNGSKVKIKNPDDVWNYIEIGNEIMVSSRPDVESKDLYISLECECEWEVEHGLQIVLKNGLCINKIGSFDGHLTNSDAYGRKEFENKIYIGISDLC